PRRADRCRRASGRRARAARRWSARGAGDGDRPRGGRRARRRGRRSSRRAPPRRRRRRARGCSPCSAARSDATWRVFSFGPAAGATPPTLGRPDGPIQGGGGGRFRVVVAGGQAPTASGRPVLAVPTSSTHDRARPSWPGPVVAGGASAGGTLLVVGLLGEDLRVLLQVPDAGLERRDVLAGPVAPEELGVGVVPGPCLEVLGEAVR